MDREMTVMELFEKERLREGRGRGSWSTGEPDHHVCSCQYYSIEKDQMMW
jgi:hypothetical protein